MPTDFGRGGEGGSVGGGTAEAEEGRDGGKDGALFDGGPERRSPMTSEEEEKEAQ